MSAANESDRPVVTKGRSNAMTTEADKSAIRALIDSAADALRERDADKAVARYSPSALLFDLAPPLATRVSADDLRAWLDTWEGPVIRETRDLAIEVEGDLAFAHFYVRTTAVTKSDKERAQWWARTTLCFKRKEGKWLVVHEHVSVPFYMDGSYRAALDLEPPKN
jgi:ketosteroid isomerase-like protein